MSEYFQDDTVRTGELTERVLAHFGCTGDTYRGGQKYVGMTQLRTDAGWDVTTGDVVIMGAWKSTSHEIQGFEVKVSRSDWLNEVKKPNKNQAIKQYCDRFWLVISDEKMVKDGELPEDWGMMVASGNGLKVVKKAPKLTPVPITPGFMAMMLRSNQSETIPVDVHHDRMKDIERKYEAEFKAKYAGLLDFVKLMQKELGIKIAHTNYSNKGWYASIDSWEIRREVANGAHELTPAQLAAAVKLVLKGDLSAMKYRLDSLNATAQEILKLTKEFDDAG